MKRHVLLLSASAVILSAATQRQTAMRSKQSEAAYGQDPAQTLDLIQPRGQARRPIVVYIHGGGWMIGDKVHGAQPKGDHLVSKGYAFASVNYRLVPRATVEQQAADIASALAWLRAKSAGSNHDGDRMILMGHSAGAHLAALVATDPRYLAAAGVPMHAVDGVILLDGAGYDIVRQMASPRYPVRRMYEAAFGTNPSRQRALSPTHHAAAPNVARWLILPVAHRQDSVAQSNGLAIALRRAGAGVQVTPVPNSSHSKLNRQLGTAGDFATAEVDRFLASLR